MTIGAEIVGVHSTEQSAAYAIPEPTAVYLFDNRILHFILRICCSRLRKYV